MSLFPKTKRTVIEEKLTRSKNSFAKRFETFNTILGSSVNPTIQDRENQIIRNAVITDTVNPNTVTEHTIKQNNYMILIPFIVLGAIGVTLYKLK